MQVELLRDEEIEWADLRCAEHVLGEFGGDNRAGIEGTLHRISALRNRKNVIVGLTCRVGRAISGHVDMIQDLLAQNDSLLFLGRPGKMIIFQSDRPAAPSGQASGWLIHCGNLRAMAAGIAFYKPSRCAHQPHRRMESNFMVFRHLLSLIMFTQAQELPCTDNSH